MTNPQQHRLVEYAERPRASVNADQFRACRIEVPHFGSIRPSAKVRHPIHKRTREDLES